MDRDSEEALLHLGCGSDDTFHRSPESRFQLGFDSVHTVHVVSCLINQKLNPGRIWIRDDDNTGTAARQNPDGYPILLLSPCNCA